MFSFFSSHTADGVDHSIYMLSIRKLKIFIFNAWCLCKSVILKVKCNLVKSKVDFTNLIRFKVKCLTRSSSKWSFEESLYCRATMMPVFLRNLSVPQNVYERFILWLESTVNSDQCKQKEKKRSFFLTGPRKIYFVSTDLDKNLKRFLPVCFTGSMHSGLRNPNICEISRRYKWI